MSKAIRFVVLSALTVFAASAQAGYTKVTIGQSAYLGSTDQAGCGGTVEVNNGGRDDQVNLVFRGVTECSFYDDSNGKDQRLNLGAGITNAYTISTASQNTPGDHTIRVYIHSKSQKHSDTIDVAYHVNTPVSAAALELARSGSINGYPVIAYFGGQSNADFQARMQAICQSTAVGTAKAVSYTVKAAAYNGQTALELKNGAWNYRTIKDASQAAVFSVLNCSY